MAGAGNRDAPKRKLGPVMCTALVVGSMIGSGVFLLPTSLAPLGWNSVYGWLATIAGSLCVVAVLMGMSRGRAGSCAPYSYPAAAFGPGTGFVVAWSYWISVWVGTAAIAIAAVSNFSIVWPALAAPGVPAVAAVCVLWILVLVNCLGVRAAGGVQVVTTLLKLIPLGGAILLALWLMGSGSAAVADHDSVPISASGIGAAATLALFAMLGFEAAMVAGDRAENAERTVPRATLIGVLIAGVIYLFACSAMTLMLPVEALQSSNSPFATFFASLAHPALGPVAAAFVTIAALGAINGYILQQAEMPLCLARHGLLPAWIATLNRNEIPYRIHIVSTALASAVVLANYSRGLAGLFQFMLLVTTSVSIIFYLACVLAALKLAREGRIANTAGFAAVAVAALGYSLWAFYGAGIEPSLWSLGMTAAALPIYLLMRSASRASPIAEALPTVSPGSAA
jgi:basic amino acid/polyamine antiporter, APA family